MEQNVEQQGKKAEKIYILLYHMPGMRQILREKLCSWSCRGGLKSFDVMTSGAC